ncbi:enolase C-terminal domain-like protein [Micromonospora sp. ATCC 39149]|uniref:enolase C-terminal domain-like protein n=1 Tax=Micromonospora sp. (strain ATCC 39149 / NRRL 15099 / SCC 1413) TaxID=219305 RepID=UPI00210159E4|nr:enolase C-terminal domain-like protein [Micromonospora sp. ATCC 39149]
MPRCRRRGRRPPPPTCTASPEPSPGSNVKLAKCGGVAAARRLIDTAAGYGMDVMLGCLVASTLGIAPALHLAGHARWVDLDGHLLLADDPWTGIGGADGTLRTPGGPGLGVRPTVADPAAHPALAAQPEVPQ